MTIYEMATLMQDGLVGLFIILLGLVKLPKLDVNLWGFIAKSIGNAITVNITK